MIAGAFEEVNGAAAIAPGFEEVAADGEKGRGGHFPFEFGAGGFDGLADAGIDVKEGMLRKRLPEVEVSGDEEAEDLGFEFAVRGREGAGGEQLAGEGRVFAAQSRGARVAEFAGVEGVEGVEDLGDGFEADGVAADGIGRRGTAAEDETRELHPPIVHFGEAGGAALHGGDGGESGEGVAAEAQRPVGLAFLVAVAPVGGVVPAVVEGLFGLDEGGVVGDEAAGEALEVAEEFVGGDAVLGIGAGDEDEIDIAHAGSDFPFGAAAAEIDGDEAGATAEEEYGEGDGEAVDGAVEGEEGRAGTPHEDIPNFCLPHECASWQSDLQAGAAVLKQGGALTEALP